MTEYEVQKIKEAAELVAAYCDHHECHECPFALVNAKDLWYECVFHVFPAVWNTRAIGDNDNFIPEDEEKAMTEYDVQIIKETAGLQEFTKFVDTLASILFRNKPEEDTQCPTTE